MFREEIKFKASGARKSSPKVVLYIYVLALFVLLIATCISAQAEDQLGTLQVALDDDTIKQIPADAVISVTIYQVGIPDLDSNEGWKLYEEYNDYGILEAKTAYELNEAVKNLANDITVMQTGVEQQLMEGVTLFNNLEQGVYLCVVTSEMKDFSVKPFIVTIPSLDHVTHRITYNYSMTLITETIPSPVISAKPTPIPTPTPAPTPTVEPEINYDTSFSFHKGLHFGMTEEEAIQFEEETNSTIFEGDNEEWGIKNWTKGKTTFANHDSTMFLSFHNNKLVSVVFHCSGSDSYYDNKKILTEKYGAPCATGGNYKELPIKGYSAIGLYLDTRFQNDNNKTAHGDVWSKLKFNDSVQYIYKAENSYIIIESVYYTTQYYIVDATFEGVLTSYSYIDKEIYEKYMKEAEEEYQEQKENQYNDL